MLLHYVEPWDADDRRNDTIIGRMTEGTGEGAMLFDNAFDVGYTGDLSEKSEKSRFAFGLIFEDERFGIWSDLESCVFYVTSNIPRNQKTVYALTKRDGTLDYNVISRADDLLKTLVKLFYARGLRYDSPALRESFFRVLDYLGIK